MTLTQAGPRCDVCGDFILLENLRWFSIQGIKDELCCHAERCTPVLVAADEADDWTMLPDGPIRKAFERATADGAVQEG